MEIKSLYREIVNEHNLYPGHKYDLENPTMVLQGINPSCGDDINLQLRIENDIITDASFNGSGCAISQASADMMIDLIIGKRKEEALRLAETFMGMIKGTATADQIENLEEAAALQDISHMPARVKCAVLGWRTMRQMLEEINK
ncbi:MAG: SUF system NifU family Fe-S cluster assembly protein [Lachnospiraceae bacterium]|jgi:nitrogen fixation NifU-like protein|nr:SUF system NifU family Fe-S cluster assembly protein [Lachnospiraceae bacterium]